MSMTDTQVTQPTCTRIVVEHAPDYDPDLSWLEQECFNDYQEGSTLPDGGVNYGRNRIAAYERGEWWCIGIRATATVLVPMGGMSVIQTIESGGLWGIDYDPASPGDERDPYLASIETEQMDELRDILAALNVAHDGAEVTYSR